MSLLLDTPKNAAFMDEITRGVTRNHRAPTKSKLTTERIAVIGLGYVGLPLAICLADRFAKVIGLDISADRIRQLRDGHDQTHEICAENLLHSGLQLTDEATDIGSATFYIVTVPTPITSAHQPDLAPLISACHAIAPHLVPGDVVVFESTVYPGVTEDICGKLLSDLSGLKQGVDFSLGYSPERINPGDKINTVEKIVKIVAGDSPAALDRIAAVYGAVIEAGIYRCPSIKVAEGAKVLENTQRDVNIALMNELSLICDKIGIATADVIEAASTKWNFMPFTPGLVGGHCIGVDPYYLASLAEQIGLHPQVILAGRRLNDSMVDHIAHTALKLLIRKGGAIEDARIGVFGITFKENVPDIRNSKAVELIHQMRGFGLSPLVFDAHCDRHAAEREGIALSDPEQACNLDLMILASPHRVYLEDATFLARLRPGAILMDIRSAFIKRPRPAGLSYWSL